MDTNHGKIFSVAFTGPECSGKSFLAQKISERYHADYIPEYAREFLEPKNGIYQFEDIEKIAKVQWKWINKKSKNIKIIDTELLVLEIWSKVKFNRCCSLILDHVQNQSISHFFLCKPDIPWEFDHLRENPYDRLELFELYQKKLENYSLPYTIVEGTKEQRLNTCIDEMESLIRFNN
ncbi:MAG: AAA family ATPase [Flavobacteriia bacterium]|nr:AAA family ATPase [Flavobacteriia bacterium]